MWPCGDHELNDTDRDYAFPSGKLSESWMKLIGHARDRYSRATVFGHDGVPLRANHHDLPRDVAAHDHDFYEVALVTAGRGNHLTAAGEEVLHRGSVVLIPPNQWHGYSDCEEVAVVDCFIGPELFDRELSFLLDESPLVAALAHRTFPSSQRVELDAAQMDRALRELDALSDEKRTSRLAALGHLVVLVDVLGRSWVPTKIRSRRTHDRLHPAVARTATMLESSPQRRWTLAELAEAASVDRTHLVRMFQRELGIPPIAYLNQLRQQEAAQLLVQTDLPIAQIGSRVGWDDAAYFARRFKAAYGLSPSAYRGRARAGEAGH